MSSAMDRPTKKTHWKQMQMQPLEKNASYIIPGPNLLMTIEVLMGKYFPCFRPWAMFSLSGRLLLPCG